MNHAVCVRPGVDPSPLFVVHADASGLADVHELAGHVDSGVAIYAMCPASVDEVRLTTLEGMATWMTRVIRAIQPVGAYRVAGLSSGGLLAYEVATQLLGQDQRVEFLGLMDTQCHDDGAGAYRPQPITVPVHLFVRDQPALANPDLGWHAIVPDGFLRVIRVPCQLGSALATAIRSVRGDAATQPATCSRLVPLQSRPHRVPALMCIPGAGADVTSFIHIVSCLGDSWPVYGAQPRGLDGALVPHSTVPAAARAYVAAMDEAYPRGPAHLLGHSFGGWVACEMACLLSEAGRSVTAVTLLDSEPPDADHDAIHEYTDMDCLREWLDGVEQQLGRPLGVDRADLESRTGPQQRELLHRRMVRSGMLPPQSSPGVLRGRLRTFAAALRTSYCPQRPYEGAVTLVLVDDPDLDADGNRQRAREAVDGWRRWAPGLRCIKAPGNHITMLSQPHGEFLADVVRPGLSQA
jgi:thioesterase domain-containing protein